MFSLTRASLSHIMATTIPPNWPPNLLQHRRRASPSAFAGSRCMLARRRLFHRPHLSCRVASDGGAADHNPRPSAAPRLGADREVEVFNSSVSSGDGYVGLFVRMLGLDNDSLDREQAVITLWKYSEGGKNCIDGIMQFPGCINLIVSLLKSDSPSTCEAAAGLLKTISSVKSYRDIVAKSGAMEEVTALLCQPSLAQEVKEQSLFALWNLSVDEEIRGKIATSDLLQVLVKLLDDEELKVKEAAGGILANLALCSCYHSIMVEAGVIPKLAELLKRNEEGYKVIRKEAKNSLLELSKDDYYRILIIEESLVRVPIVGIASYKSFKPVPHSWPSLPDGTELQRSSRPSRYGASELLLGLNIRDRDVNLAETKMNAIVGRSQQQFLARIGAIEMEDGAESRMGSSQAQMYTLLPWVDGVARLVLILGLEDIPAISRAAYAIADAAISEHMRISFKEAGAVRPLVKLLYHNIEAIREAAAHALDRLSISSEVCKFIEEAGVMDPLIDILECKEASKCLLEKAVNILSRICDPRKDMRRKLSSKAVNEPEEVTNTACNSQDFGGLTMNLDTIGDAGLTARERIFNTDLLSRLVEIFKLSSANLQTKVASILEYQATSESYALAVTAAGIEDGLVAVFQKASVDVNMDNSGDNQLEADIAEAEEIGLAIAAAARLLTKLLDFEQFRSNIQPMHFITLLRQILISEIPLHFKDWVAACLVKLESQLDSKLDFTHPINTEVTVYETIPRLVEQIRESFSREAKEAAVIELNEIISRGVAEYTRAVATSGGIFPLVKMIDEGNGVAMEASLAILYSLSMDSENHSAMIAAGFIPVLKRIILSEGPHWTRALHLLRTLPT